MGENNGAPGGKEADELDQLDDWIFLTPTLHEAGVIARCMQPERGLTADSWSKPGIKHELRGRKVILVFKTPDTAEQKDALAMAMDSKAMVLRLWRPTFYGRSSHETLTDIDEDLNLGLVIALEKPWLAPPKGHDEIAKVGRLTVGLNEIKLMKVNWLYENRIAPGFISLFAGRSGLGKSFVTCDIVARFSRGEPAYRSDVMILDPIRTLFISEDSPEVVIGPRLMELGAAPSMVRFMTWDAMARWSIDDTEFLTRAYEECERPGLLVIDPPANFIGKADSHKDSDVRGVLKGLIAWIDTHKVAAILITHINKQIGKGMDAVDRIMGSVAWGTTARITCAFAKDPDIKGQVLFGGTKNNLGTVAEPLAFRIDKTDNLATVVWVGISDTTMDDAIDKVKKKSRGQCATEWLEDRFREKPEWPSDELKQMASEAGHSKNALWSPEVNALPIRKIKRTAADGESFWVWRANDGWPQPKSDKKDENVGNLDGDYDWTRT
jgi:AAA domain